MNYRNTWRKKTTHCHKPTRCVCVSKEKENSLAQATRVCVCACVCLCVCLCVCACVCVCVCMYVCEGFISQTCMHRWEPCDFHSTAHDQSCTGKKPVKVSRWEEKM